MLEVKPKELWSSIGLDQLWYSSSHATDHLVEEQLRHCQLARPVKATLLIDEEMCYEILVSGGRYRPPRCFSFRLTI